VKEALGEVGIGLYTCDQTCHQNIAIATEIASLSVSVAKFSSLG